MSEPTSDSNRFEALLAVLEDLLAKVRGKHMPATIESCFKNEPHAEGVHEIVFDRRLRSRGRLSVHFFADRFRLADFEELAAQAEKLPKKTRLVVGAGIFSNTAKKRLELADWCNGWFDINGGCLIQSDYLHIEVSRPGRSVKRASKEKKSDPADSKTAKILQVLIDPDDWSRTRRIREIEKSLPEKVSSTLVFKVVEKYVADGCIRKPNPRDQFEIIRPLNLFEVWLESCERRSFDLSILRYNVDVKDLKQKLLEFPRLALTAESASRCYLETELDRLFEAEIQIRASRDVLAAIELVVGDSVADGGNLLVLVVEAPFELREKEVEISGNNKKRGVIPIEAINAKLATPLDTYLDLLAFDFHLGKENAKPFYEQYILPRFKPNVVNREPTSEA